MPDSTPTAQTPNAEARPPARGDSLPRISTAAIRSTPESTMTLGTVPSSPPPTYEDVLEEVRHIV
jgi:hypothetical protein